jgi:predicted thioesterase
MVFERTYIVQFNDTARSSGGETLPVVLSTPRMIGLMEFTCQLLVLPHLAEGQTSVGSLVNIRHLAATPEGMTVRLRAELVEVDRRRLRFKVEAWDALEKIGEGEHERFIIDKDRFETRLEEKRSLLKD